MKRKACVNHDSSSGARSRHSMLPAVARRLSLHAVQADAMEHRDVTDTWELVSLFLIFFITELTAVWKCLCFLLQRAVSPQSVHCPWNRYSHRAPAQLNPCVVSQNALYHCPALILLGKSNLMVQDSILSQHTDSSLRCTARINLNWMRTDHANTQ